MNGRVPTSTKLVPKWWYRVAALKAEGKATGAIAADVGKSASHVSRVLTSPWMRETLARIEHETRERLIRAAVDPRVQAQLEAPAAMGRLIAAARTAEKPLEVAAINKDVLNYAGYAPAEKKLIMSVTATIDELPLEVLEEWERTKQLPTAVQATLDGTPDSDAP